MGCRAAILLLLLGLCGCDSRVSDDSASSGGTAGSGGSAGGAAGAGAGAAGVAGGAGSSTIKNGDFAAGAAHWQTFAQYGGAVTIAADTGELAVNVAALGTELTDVQVKSDGGLNLVAGDSYQFSFEARADSQRPVDTSIWENGHDLNGDGFAWSTHNYETHLLTTSMSTFTVDFTMPVTNDDAGVCFFVGASTVALYIDNVTLTELP